ncbi:hypothetical protein BDW62DRAFT_206563 [Aspergillus aurantiobrunneus]
MARYPEDSSAPAVIVLTRFLLVTLILASLARLATKWWKFGSFFRDDYYALLAMLVSIAQAVAVSVSVTKGYGSPVVQLSENQIAGILKAQYAAVFFYIAGIALSQLSFLCFVQYLVAHHRRISTVQQVGITVVAIVGVLGSAFQCHPRQWDYIHDRCFNREAWFIYLAVSMILVEAVIIAQAVIMMVKVQTTWRQKLNLMSVFLFRIFVPGGLIAQITLTHNTIHSPDPTSSTWSTVICTQLVLCLSVVTASTPQLVPILRKLQSSGMRLDGMSRYTVTTSKQDSRSRYFLSGRRTGNESIHELDNMPIVATKTTVTAGYPENAEDQDDGSQSSQTGIIRETRTFVLMEEHVQDQRLSPIPT